MLKQKCIDNKLYFFKDSTEALDYLRITSEHLFIINSKVNLVKMDKLSFRTQIQSNELLRSKVIPFISLTNNPSRQKVKEAYEMIVQGYFIKPHSSETSKNMIQMLMEY